MKKAPAETTEYYDRAITVLIAEKYGMTPMDALRQFVYSETHRMLDNDDLEMWNFSPLAILDMWENEKVTGDPRNSIYIRGE